MKGKIYFVLLFLGFIPNLMGQTNDGYLHGVVSYMNGSSIYVKFANTSDITKGDTLLINKEGTLIPCLIVTAKSSISCVTSPLNNCQIKLNDPVIFPAKVIEKPKAIDSKDSIRNKAKQIPVTKPIAVNDSKKDTGNVANKQVIYGRITAASYSTFSNVQNASRHSLTGRLSFNIDHINRSKMSLETYLNYRQNILDGPTPTDYQTKFFRVYNLALNYEFSKGNTISLGRKINNKMSSVGALDGLQVERKLGKFYTGAIAGFRPDVFNYSLNTNLLQYGAYIGYTNTGSKHNSETTLGLIEQRNKGKIDRRYGYVQQSGRFSEKISFFGSMELELYKNINGTASVSPRLTSFYYSLNYQLNRKLNMMASFDSRRNIIFYESFVGNEVDRLLSDDLARQGFRYRINYKMTKYLYSGLSYSKRYQSDGENKSDNLYGFITHSKLPWIGGSLNLNVNMNNSNYLESRVLAVRYSRGLFKEKLDFSLYYRLLNYNYVTRDVAKSLQHYYGTNLSVRLNKNLSFNVLGELSLRDIENNYRVNFSITQRFKS